MAAGKPYFFAKIAIAAGNSSGRLRRNGESRGARSGYDLPRSRPLVKESRGEAGRGTAGRSAELPGGESVEQERPAGESSERSEPLWRGMRLRGGCWCCRSYVLSLRALRFFASGNEWRNQRGNGWRN